MDDYRKSWKTMPLPPPILTDAENLVIDFVVYGEPKPQGSKKALMPKNARFPVVVESAGEPLKHWRSAVSQTAADCMGERSVITGPVLIDIEFYFLRPKAHFGTGRNAEKLKDSAPQCHQQKPDADKLVRSVLDSLTSIVYRDDSQVVGLTAAKRWTTDKAKAVIRVTGETLCTESFAG